MVPSEYERQVELILATDDTHSLFELRLTHPDALARLAPGDGSARNESLVAGGASKIRAAKYHAFSEGLAALLIEQAVWPGGDSSSGRAEAHFATGQYEHRRLPELAAVLLPLRSLENECFAWPRAWRPGDIRRRARSAWSE
jgi:hypothetical protein